MRSRSIFLLLLVVLANGASLYAASVTRTFQQGSSGYSGVGDTQISTDSWDTPPQHTLNFGQNELLSTARGGSAITLIRFDLASIPPNSSVERATLSMHAVTQTTQSRRVAAYRILRDWDEGNQTRSPIDATGKHGATGDNASAHFAGEGTDVAWAERGMKEGVDFDAAILSEASVGGAGDYQWDVTALVRSWTRLDSPNYGLVLRDLTGYSDTNPDSRDYASSQYVSDPALRPRLVITWNPDTPMANAGPDQSNLGWMNSAVTLDASASRDRLGGNDGSLTYSWRIVEAAYGSALSGMIPNAGVTTRLMPDVPGEWELELTVRNSVGETATDRVHLRLLSLSGHPRIFLTPRKLAALRSRATQTNIRWTQLQASEVDLDKALVSVVAGTSAGCSDAIASKLAQVTAGDSDQLVPSAIIYDWCHDSLTPQQRTSFIGAFAAWADKPKTVDDPGWGNYWPSNSYTFAVIGLATYGDDARAQGWFDEYRHTRFRDHDLANLDYIADGGGWPEGTVYDWIANRTRIAAVEAWRTATGENLFFSTPWFRNRLGTFLLRRQPGLWDYYGLKYHPYVAIGDSERYKVNSANYERIMSLILIEQFPADSLSRQTQAYLDAPPTNNSRSFLYADEFLWFNPDQPRESPAELTHYDPSLGLIFARSGWPGGAADVDTSPTHLSFQCGDHFTYHQHFDQNSFTLFKHADLLVESGVYSGNGLSYHDVNYYLRTVAHNTLVVYNNLEDFSSMRDGAESDDGGQRSMFPGNRLPESVEYRKSLEKVYETGNMLRFETGAQYTYALGDATAAYNSPSYNQASDTPYTNNVAKVTRFQRELVYLRPSATGADFVVLFDRVGVTQPGFSGANTKLLFHTLNEPVVAGNGSEIAPGETLYAAPDQASASAGDGKVFLQFLLPPARNVRKVGGPGKTYWVFGRNYDWNWTPGGGVGNDTEDRPYGEWRLELEPGDTALDHNFLTVIHPTSAATSTMPAVTLITGNGISGAQIADGDMNRVVVFSSAFDGATPAGDIGYTFSATGRTQHLIFDLTPGSRYQLTTSASSVLLSKSGAGNAMASSQGVVTFETGSTTQSRPRPRATPDASPTSSARP